MKNYLLTGLLLLMSSSFLSAAPDKIAILYFHSNDVTTKRFSKTDLISHFSTPNAPVRKFWEEVSGKRYDFNCKVFTVQLDSSEVAITKLKGRQFTTILEKNFKNLQVDGYNPADFNKTIILIGSTKYGAMGNYRGYWNHRSGLYVNGSDHIVSGGFFEYPYVKNALGSISTNGLWRIDATLLHEWGHSVGMKHSNYLLTDKEPAIGKVYAFAYDNRNSTYDNHFDIMGDHETCLHPNAYQKRIAGWLDSSEVITIKEDKKNITIQPLENAKGIRAVEIKCPGKFKLPRYYIPNKGKANYIEPGMQQASLFIEYRQAIGFDDNLGKYSNLSNTKGIVVCLVFPDLNLTNDNFVGKDSSSKDFYRKKYAQQSWLLDMSPDNKRTIYDPTLGKTIAVTPDSDLSKAIDDHYDATLNAGWEFYDEQLQVTISNVRPDGNNGVTFDVKLGKREEMSSMVKKMPAFTEVNAPFLGDATRDAFGDGTAVSADGKIMVIGAPCGLNGKSGYLRTYQMTGGQWQKTGNDLSENIGNAGFGSSLALSANGDKLAVGAPAKSTVYIYERSGNTWNKTKTLTRSNSKYYGFGTSLAFSTDGNILAVGTPRATEKRGIVDIELGKVSIYQLQGANWEKMGEDISGEEQFDNFGTNLAFAEGKNRLAILAPGYYQDTNVAYVKVFQLESGNWTQLGKKITANSPFELFSSFAISSDGDEIFIGIPGNGKEINTKNYKGLVRGYNLLMGDIWSEKDANISSIEGVIGGAGFGSSVYFYNNDRRLAVVTKGVGTNEFMGTLTIYKRTTNRKPWKEVTKINGTDKNFFSGQTSIASSGKVIVVGNSWSSEKGFQTGKVATFNRNREL